MTTGAEDEELSDPLVMTERDSNCTAGELPKCKH